MPGVTETSTGMLFDELAFPIIPTEELACIVILYPVILFVSTANDVKPLAVPPVMPPRVGDMMTLDGGVANDISLVTVCEMVNWDEVVAPRVIAGSMVMKAIARIVMVSDAVRIDFKSDLNI